jgi:hypothetical protein
MKNLNTKSIMVIAIVFSSIGVMPMAAIGQEKEIDDVFNFNQVDVGIFDGFRGGFGAIFSQNLGYAGGILGSIFETLFLQGLDLSAHEKLENVYVISANTTETYTGTRTFTPGLNDKEYYFLPNDYEIPTGEGFAYCEITKSGSYYYELEIGAAVTLVIWDNDQSFINAVNKLLNFFKKVINYEYLGQDIPVDLIKEGISILTWFLIHINDIFTGDELFVLNPITWQKLNITPIGYTIDKNWYMSGNDYVINPGSDLPVPASYLMDWYNNATTWKDSYMEWLLTPTLPGDLAETIWTQFSFDLIQLWVKNFEIHIDVAKILDAATGGGGDPANLIATAFEGCDIEFYLFTHHLAGAFLYDDAFADNRITANYVNVTDTGGQVVTDPAGDPVQVPDGSELTHRLILSTVENFKFNKPTINTGDKSISWGIRLQNVNISAVPMFVDLDSYLKAPEEELEYIYFGFTFEPTIDEETNAARGNVKLDQQFAPWNGGSGPNSFIPGLDLAIIYVSTVLHFHLNVAVEDSSETEVILDPSEDYIESSNELKVGNYLGKGTADKLDFVNISGPYYEIGMSRPTAVRYDASTNILPLMLWTWEMERHDTITLEGETSSTTFASDIRINTEFNVMLYAVCYPEFDGTGEGIWHDPTFSVYMVFQGEGFWALIVLIAGVGLVGVATILIKRRKDRRF